MGNNLKVHITSDFRAFSYTQNYFSRAFKKDFKTIASSLEDFVQRSSRALETEEFPMGKDQEPANSALCKNAGVINVIYQNKLFISPSLLPSSMWGLICTQVSQSSKQYPEI